MTLLELKDIEITQKKSLAKQNSGFERWRLLELPDIQSHALVVSGIRRC
jgi:hypothetical protein